ncbi:hypothetical protein [Deinococcus yavapaiensis]|uniref:Uncharacterized protein n=1 Tax=Deinococcus yavapaiensis KR-236 TaxID=694435 RepID=A0A318SBI6_9DEIO|nr:hypothetical protein [Deinococcus yavapaiensis]PYE54097.1 hypothetical protein DES52_10659 [Deinococcus yavapaiensis KR-236]
MNDKIQFLLDDLDPDLRDLARHVIDIERESLDKLRPRNKDEVRRLIEAHVRAQLIAEGRLPGEDRLL